MKLIDLLVQELPKRGGWPSSRQFNLNWIAQDTNGEFWGYPEKPSFTFDSWRVANGDGYFAFSATLCSDHQDEDGLVTRQQYEAALAASQQPAWNGEGIPPVGCKFEYGSHRTTATCLGVGLDMVFAWKGDPLQDTYEEFMISIKDSCFRPIRTEAERKRDEAIKFMSSVFRDHVDNKKSNGQDSVFHAIYDAFKAGKFE